MKTAYRPTSMMDKRLLSQIMEHGEWSPIAPSIQSLGTVMVSILDLAILLVNEGRREGFETNAAFFPAGAEEIASALKQRFGSRQISYTRKCVERALLQLKKCGQWEWWELVGPSADPKPEKELSGLWVIQHLNGGVHIIIRPKLIEMLTPEVASEDL